MGSVQKKSYQQFDPGTYTINGIEFFSKDRAGLPIFKSVDTRYGGMLVAQYRTFAGEDQGPPGSVAPADLSLLAVAFGIDPTQLPEDRTKALPVLEQLIAETPKEVDVYVGKAGWISSVTGMDVPVGEYLFSRGQIVSREDGVPAWYDGDYGEYCLVSLELVMNADGTPSLYKGTTAAKVWVMRKSFSIPRAMVPDRMEQAFGPVDGELEVFAAALTRANKDTYIYGEIVEGKKRPKIAPLSLKAIPIGSVVSPTQTGTTTEVLEPPHMQALYDAIAFGVEITGEGGKAFGADGKLAASGKKWCGANLKPIAKQHNLPTAFSKMDLEIVQIYLSELGSAYAKFLAATQPEPVVEDDFGGEEEEDSWD